MSTRDLIFALIVLCPIGFMIMASTIFRKRLGHDVLGWHDCDATGFDGASFTGTCKYCGKKCLQDSQGNWFTLDEA